MQQNHQHKKKIKKKYVRVKDEKKEIEINKKEDNLMNQLGVIILKLQENQEEKCKNCSTNDVCDCGKLEICDKILLKISNLFPIEYTTTVYKQTIESGGIIIQNILPMHSMCPNIKYGDLIVLGNDIIKKGDVINFEYAGGRIVHRVLDIDRNNGVYITKGDNTESQEKVFFKRVIGKVLYIIKPQDKKIYNAIVNGGYKYVKRK